MSGREYFDAHTTRADVTHRVRNDYETDPATVTITSAPDPYGRTKDIAAYSLEAGEFAAFWVGKSIGWRQSDGKVWLSVAGTGTINFAVLRIRD